jgi:lantibiotic modifying enzyme
LVIDESDFLALIEAAGDFDDLRTNRYFLFRKPAKGRQFSRFLRIWTNGDTAKAAEGRKALEKWVNSAQSDGLKLRDPARLPKWARRLQRMFAHFGRSKHTDHGSLCARLVQPAITFGCAELQRRLQNYGSPLPVSVLQRFERQLEQRLTATIQSSLEFNLKMFEAAFRCVFPARGELGREEIEQEFIEEGSTERLIAILQSYPALAKLWSQLIGDWVDKVAELGARLNKDRRSLRRALFDGCNPGDLSDVTVNISDPHRGARETVILRFRNGCIVYKPRSGRSESDWFSLVHWINRLGFAPPLRTLRLLQRPDYCWMEFVEHLPCQRKNDAHHYYRRAGGLICAAYLLGAVDCHRDNLIASGDQPILIDAETFFHYQAPSVLDETNESIVRTGLLPVPRSLSCSPTDIGAFGGASGSHTPVLNGKLLSSSDYSADLLRGFGDMWKLIGEPGTQTRAAFCRRLRRLAHRPWRRIHRSTRSYFEIRERSLDPGALQSGLGRSCRIARDLLRLGLGASIILEEVSALGRFDIPYFLEAVSEDLLRTDTLLLSDLLLSLQSALFRAD